MRIAITCKHMQRDIEDYREQMEGLFGEIVVPRIPGQELAGQELITAMAGVDAVIAGDDKFTDEVMAALPDLKVISKWGIGLDGVDLDAASERAVTVTNTPGMFNDEVAEMALGYVIASVRGIVSTDRAVRRGEWVNPVGRSLGALRLTILGLGNIGLALAAKAKALGMPVAGVDPSASAQAQARELDVEIGELANLLGSTDVLVVTCPLNAATQGIVNASAISSMPTGSYLIIVGRGPVAVDAAVSDALASGHLRGAALDVFEAEPLPADSPLRNHPNCILGTHNSSNTFEACHRTHQAAIDNLVHSFGGEQ